MNLHEYQAKQLFAEFGLPVPEGKLTGIKLCRVHKFILFCVIIVDCVDNYLIVFMD